MMNDIDLCYSDLVALYAIFKQSKSEFDDIKEKANIAYTIILETFFIIYGIMNDNFEKMFSGCKYSLLILVLIAIIAIPLSMVIFSRLLDLLFIIIRKLELFFKWSNSYILNVFYYYLLPMVNQFELFTKDEDNLKKWLQDNPNKKYNLNRIYADVKKQCTEYFRFKSMFQDNNEERIRKSDKEYCKSVFKIYDKRVLKDKKS